ncbi:MAG: aminopeptidase P family protein [Firmicutes bacterium]|nr:aminopeptidase P family protein [Bacillota bacterium]
MRDRIDRLLGSIAEDEAVLISSYPNIFYYSGFTSADAYLFITHNKSYIITDSRYTIQAAEEAPDFELHDISKGFEELFKKADERAVGFEEEHMSVKEYNRFEKRISNNQELVLMQKNIDEPRKIKDKNEIEKLATAEAIGDRAFEHILTYIKAGRTEKEVALELEYFMKKQGASALSFATIAASGERSAMPHGTASDKVIENGDFLTLDFGCVFNGYCSDMTRTVVVGKAADWQREIYDVVLKAQLAGLDALETGKKCAAVDAVSRKIISDAGYGKNFGHSLGHSVGIEIHENPVLSPKSGDTVKDGNIFTVEPGIYIDGMGGVRIEDMTVMENGRARNLAASPKELIEL